MSDRTECHLCAGSGEVYFVPMGAPDCAADNFGCPACVAAERDEEIARLTADNIRMRAALEQIEGMSDYALSMDATQVARDALNRSAP